MTLPEEAILMEESCVEAIDTYLDGAQSALCRYFDSADDGQLNFSGSRFHRLWDGDDPLESADIIRPADLLAVQTLSVRVPIRQSMWLLDQGAQGGARQISDLLSLIDPEVEPQSVKGRHLLTDRDSALWKAWRLLRERPGMGWVTAGKLLARKRPHIAPIYDTVVQKAVGRPRSWWDCLAEYFGDSGRTQRVIDIRRRAGREELSLLRVIDVSIWTQAKYGSKSCGHSEH